MTPGSSPETIIIENLKTVRAASEVFNQDLSISASTPGGAVGSQITYSNSSVADLLRTDSVTDLAGVGVSQTFKIKGVDVNLKFNIQATESGQFEADGQQVKATYKKVAVAFKLDDGSNASVDITVPFKYGIVAGSLSVGFGQQLGDNSRTIGFNSEGKLSVPVAGNVSFTAIAATKQELVPSANGGGAQWSQLTDKVELSANGSSGLLPGAAAIVRRRQDERADRMKKDKDQREGQKTQPRDRRAGCRQPEPPARKTPMWRKWRPLPPAGKIPPWRRP